MRRLLLASSLMLFIGVSTIPRAHSSAPAAQVVVVDTGAPAAGQAVVVIASEGKYEGVTNQEGRFSVVIHGKYFRVKVNGHDVPGVHPVDLGPVQVDLRNL